MPKSAISEAKTIGREIASFVVPKKLGSQKVADTTSVNLTVLIPTYKPKVHTYKLVEDLLNWHKNVSVIVIDDSTPLTAHASTEILTNIKKIEKTNKKVTLLRTPVNELKAGALNFGLAHIFVQNNHPDVVVTIDDDVVLRPDTLSYMVQALYAEKKIGAVCSIAMVKNKKKNLLTRLQALEYHGFNITKISDNGFLLGPLVMQGMLTAFRYEAIKQVKGFAVDKLIEDYDITVRIKNAGWKTAIATNAVAWTHVPETLGALWKQRIRWSYGGLIVLKESWRHLLSIFQDIIGHILFLSTILFVLLSLLFTRHTQTSETLVFLLVIAALVQFAVGMSFSILSLLTYRDRDVKDWLIKLTIFPEFVYSNMLSAILIGSYLFFAFNVLSAYATKHLPFFAKVQRTGTKSFQKLGYTASWGTRI